MMKISKAIRELVALQAERLVREDTRQGYGQDQQRKGKEDIHQPAGEGVGPAANKTGNDAERGPDKDRQQGGQERDQQRDPAAVHDPAEDVAAVHRLNAHQVIPAHPSEAADRLQRAASCVNQLLVELIRRTAEVLDDQWREYRYQNEKDQEPAAARATLSRLSRIQAICPRERPSVGPAPASTASGMAASAAAPASGGNCQFSLLPRSNVARKVSESADSALDCDRSDTPLLFGCECSANHSCGGHR